MLKRKIISSCAIIAALATPFAYADAVKLPLKHSNGKFHCTVSGFHPIATVNIDTSRVKVRGFCKGYDKHVSENGHITELSLLTLTNHYFEYKEDGSDDQAVTFTTDADGVLTCAEGPGDRTKVYGEDGDFC